MQYLFFTVTCTLKTQDINITNDFGIGPASGTGFRTLGRGLEVVTVSETPIPANSINSYKTFSKPCSVYLFDNYIRANQISNKGYHKVWAHHNIASQVNL